MENTGTSFERNATPMQVGLKYGLYLGLAMAAFALIAHYGGLQDYSSVDITSVFLVQAINWIILAVLFFFGTKYFKDNNEGHLTFGEGMITCMFIGLVSGIITVIFTFIFYSYIAPEVLDTVNEAIMSGGAVESDFSDLSEEDRKEAEAMMGSIMGFATSPSFLAVSALLNRMMSAVIFGLISSLILKTD